VPRPRSSPKPSGRPAQAFRDETNQPMKIIYETTWYRPRRETEQNPNVPGIAGGHSSFGKLDPNGPSGPLYDLARHATRAINPAVIYLA
jgi:hypothetical protein